MPGLYGTATKGNGAFPAATSWTGVATPAGLNTHTQFLVLGYKTKDAAPGAVTGWGTPTLRPHSTAPGGIAVYRRKLTADVSASTVTVPFSVAATGSYIGFTIDGDFELITAGLESDGTSEVRPQAIDIPAANCTRVDIFSSCEWQRAYPTTSGTPTVIHQPGVESGSTPGLFVQGPGLTVAISVVGIGPNSGFAHVPDDPNLPSGAPAIDTAFSGTEDWTTTIMVSVVLRPIGTAAPSPGAQSGIHPGSLTAISFLDSFGGNNIESSPAGGAQVVVLLLNRQDAIVAGTPVATVSTSTPFTAAFVTPLDVHFNRLYVWYRNGAFPDDYVTIPFSPGGIAVGRQVTFSTTGPFEASAFNVYEFTGTPSSPSILVPRPGSFAVPILASGRWQRDIAPQAGAGFSLLDAGIAYPGGEPGVSMALGYQDVGQGPYQPGLWAVSDPRAGSDPGDAYRAATLIFGPAGATGGGGGVPNAQVTITASGKVAYVAAPANGRVTAKTASSITLRWDDLSDDETDWLIRRTNQTTGVVTDLTVPALFTGTTISGLDAGTFYEFRIYAVRDGDESAPTIVTDRTDFGAFQLAITSGSDRTLVLDETATLQVSTTPAAISRPITWTISDPTVLAFNATPPTTTDGSGQATAVVKGLGKTGAATVTARVDGIVASIEFNGTTIVESLILEITPSIIEDDAVTLATVTGSQGGASLIGRTVTISSSDATVVGIPAAATFYNDGTAANPIGRARITLQAISEGNTTIQASTASATSNTVPMIVRRPEVPVAYNASGVSLITVTAETPFARARRPKVRRLTTADQKARYPDDAFFDFADEVALSNYTFFRKALYVAKQ